MWWHGGTGLIERSERRSLSAVATHDVFGPSFLSIVDSILDDPIAGFLADFSGTQIHEPVFDDKYLQKVVVAVNRRDAAVFWLWGDDCGGGRAPRLLCINRHEGIEVALRVYEIKGVDQFHCFQPNVQEHATRLAGTDVGTGVEVHVAGDVADSAASWGCGASPCSESSVSYSRLNKEHY